MDTLQIHLVNNNKFYSSTEFYAIFIAAFSLIVSIISIYLQYKKGKIYVPPIRSFGLEFLYSDENVDRSGMRCILPIAFYNSGNKHKAITDIRLAIRGTQNNYFYFRANHFVKNLGSTETGAHSVPETINWFHQIIIPPKESKIFNIEFLLSNVDDINEILNLSRIVFQIQLKLGNDKTFKTYQSFRKTITTDFIDSLAQQYIVYEPDLA
ncbi:MAG: hypothetical protein D6734_08950 [Candidatus Schekmanbacteria bacterium]|nr:MAG: hypothetical protein D6734_08950 [Candidatus Schekmanbacteria bacterium]